MFFTPTPHVLQAGCDLPSQAEEQVLLNDRVAGVFRLPPVYRSRGSEQQREEGTKMTMKGAMLES